MRGFLQSRLDCAVTRVWDTEHILRHCVGCKLHKRLILCIRLKKKILQTSSSLKMSPPEVTFKFRNSGSIESFFLRERGETSLCKGDAALLHAVCADLMHTIGPKADVA